MQRLTYNFPSGFAGTGLLMLRLALSASLLADGARLVGRAREVGSGSDGASLFVGFLLVLCAALIGTGFLTNIVQLAVVFVQAITLGTQLWATGPVNAGVFHVPMLELAIALGLAMTGPGAYSIDARLFGRQEIVIPPSLGRPLN